MQLVRVQQLAEGMILARDVFDYNGRVLLYQGMPLKKRYIDRLKEIGLFAVYIVDNESDDRFLFPFGKEEIIKETSKALDDITNQKSVCTGILREKIAELIEDIITREPIAIFLSEIKNFDNYTSEHSFNVAVLSILIGLTLGLKRSEMVDLGVGALLHDVGKMLLPRSLINKPEKLNTSEWEQIKKHPENGYKLLEKHKLSINTLSVIKEHHERINGTGYPLGLKYNQITLNAKIAMVADSFDAMSSNRVYRKGVTPYKAIKAIETMSGLYFDAKVVEAFLSNFVPYPVGAAVRLSDGQIGIVIASGAEKQPEPVVQVVFDKLGNMTHIKEVIHLTKEKAVQIVGLASY